MPLSRNEEVSFSGIIYRENRWEYLIPSDDPLNSYTLFMPYMPDRESWTVMDVYLADKKKINDVGDLADLYAAADGKALPPGPVSFSLVNLKFYLSESMACFSALVISPLADERATVFRSSSLV